MKIETTENGGVRIVKLQGRLDTNEATEFESHLGALVESGAMMIVVDLEGVDFITSSGLRVLLATAKRLKTNEGELRVANLNQTVQEIFDVSGFSSLLPVFDSVDEALRNT